MLLRASDEVLVTHPLFHKGVKWAQRGTAGTCWHMISFKTFLKVSLTIWKGSDKWSPAVLDFNTEIDIDSLCYTHLGSPPSPFLLVVGWLVSEVDSSVYLFCIAKPSRLSTHYRTFYQWASYSPSCTPQPLHTPPFLIEILKAFLDFWKFLADSRERFYRLAVPPSSLPHALHTSPCEHLVLCVHLCS